MNEKLCRLALRAYPRRFRQSMGEDLLRLYADQGRLGRPLDALSVLWELSLNALAVRWDEALLKLQRQARPMLRSASPGRPGRNGKIGESMIQDLRFACRSLVRTPLFAAAAVITLALGIGANTAVFSVVNAVILQPLPYPAPDRLALVWPQKTFNQRILAFFQQESKAFQEVSACAGWVMMLSGEGDPEQLSGAQVAHNYFRVMGVEPALGRSFGPADAEPGQSRVVILSHGLWQRRFGGDPNILGRRIQLSIEDRHSFTVVGVMPTGYRPLEGAGSWQAWVPLQRAENLEQDRSWFLMAVGRLRPGVSWEAAGAEVRRLAAQVKQRLYPRIEEERVSLAAPLPLDRAAVGETVRVRLWVLLAAVGLILLIACANVGNLLLARMASRRRELAIRKALGATSGRLVRLLLGESLVLAVAGGAVGTALCAALLSLAEGRLPEGLPRSEAIGLDTAVLAFALAVSLISALAYCAPPAWKAVRERQESGLQARSGTMTPEGRRVSSSLVGAEIALCVILTAGSLLLIQSFFKLSQVAPGFSSHHILTLSVSTPDAWPQERKRAFFRDLIPQLEALPQLESAGSIHILPFSAGNWSFPYYPQGRVIGPEESPPQANFRVVTPGYFKTMGIPLLRGRGLAPSDGAQSAAVGLINQSMARILWPGEDAVGKQIRTYAPDGPAFEVVGVVGDVKQQGLHLPAQPEMYRPFQQWTLGGSYLTLRTAGEPLQQLESVRRLIRSLSPEVPLSEVRSMDEILASSVAGSRLQAALLGGFALLALLLAVVGVYGVAAYAERRRTREFGIRIALGAGGWDVLRPVLGRALPAILIGQAAGLLAALAAGRLISGLLFEVDPADPATLAVVLLVTTAAALPACLAPACRAGRVDPVQALRSE